MSMEKYERSMLVPVGVFDSGHLLYKTKDEKPKYHLQLVDCSISKPLGEEELFDEIWYDVSDTYQPIALDILKKHGYRHSRSYVRDTRLCPHVLVRPSRNVAPYAKPTIPTEEDETVVHALRRWLADGMTDYEELQTLDYLLAIDGLVLGKNKKSS